MKLRKIATGQGDYYTTGCLFILTLKIITKWLH